MSGWQHDLLQDECKGLGKWFASRIDARYTLRKNMTIHSCGYYCDKPACIKAQRDELRDKQLKDAARYQKVRKMNARQFADLFQRSISDYKTFDDLIDEVEAK